MSFVKDEHRQVLDAYDLLNKFESPDVDRLFLEVANDPEDEVTEGFNAMAFIYPNEDEHCYFEGCWDETPMAAAKGLLETLEKLRKEGYIE